jgi:two-component system, chemotaxis family, response regulator Rcp1
MGQPSGSRCRSSRPREVRADGGICYGAPIEILLVEDNPGDVRLTIEALRDSKVRNNLHVAKDGVEAMAFLRHEREYAHVVRPDLVLLDLNLPRMDGRQVLAEMKADQGLNTIPVVVLTTSRAEQDILRSYELQANCYISKPVVSTGVLVQTNVRRATAHRLTVPDIAGAVARGCSLTRRQ